MERRMLVIVRSCASLETSSVSVIPVSGTMEKSGGPSPWGLREIIERKDHEGMNPLMAFITLFLPITGRSAMLISLSLSF